MNRLCKTLFVLLALSAINACERNTDTAPSITVSTISTAADKVSGESVLLRIQNASDLIMVSFRLNENEISLNLQADAGNDASYLALLQNLKLGPNKLEVAIGDKIVQSLDIKSHSLSGPIFSGPHQEPYLCLNQLAPGRNGNARRFAIGNGEYLDDGGLDENCHLPTRIDYVYLTATKNETNFKPLLDPRQLPTDIAPATIEDREIPFVVAIETGTINRAIYQIARLVSFDNTNPWNRRLVYTFGGGCEAGFHQGTSTGGVLREDLLARGYAIASSTLNVNRQGGCNDVISAETAMMVKEHFIETVGVPVHTIGLGSSGGAIQQHLIAGAYPGILDGLIVGASFPDAVSYFMDTAECALPLRDYLSRQDLSDEVKTAIGGWHQWSTCDNSLGERPARISPYDCAGEIPPELAYHETDNPTGIRCSIYDGMKNIFGQIPHPRVADLSVAPSPHDNTGVQYGLKALQAGLISTQLFLDLNENVGGWDIDYQPVVERNEANEQALATAYKTGRIVNGKSLADIPIIDDRAYLDAIGNFHTSVYSFSLRARLIRDNGHADNHVIRRHQRDLNLTTENVELMDAWLSSLSVQGEESSAINRIRAAKPTNLADDCFTESGERIVEAAVFTEEDLFNEPKGQCNQLYPVHGNPRIVAGGPLSGDVMKCELKPINFQEYGVEFSEAERDRLRNIFPNGVCDWSKPGLSQRQNEQWLSY